MIRFKMTASPKSSITSKKDELYRYGVIKCEFCDFVCQTKYDSLVHNAKHIIVPLLNQPLLKCTCGQYFITGEQLQLHNETDHHITGHDFKHDSLDMDLIKKIVSQNVFVKCDNTVTELLSASNEMQLQNFVKRQAVVKCDSVVTELINSKSILKESNNYENNISTNDSSINRIMNDLNHYDDSDNEVIIVESDDSEHETNNMYENRISVTIADKDTEPDSTTNDVMLPMAATDTVKSKLVFEDDLEDDDDDDIVQFDYDTGNGWLNSSAMKYNEVAKTIGSEATSSTMVAEEPPNMTSSIHYDELIVPGMHKCKKCDLKFTNRLELIIHETSHLSIRKRSRLQLCIHCEYYIAGRMLHKHIEETHPTAIFRGYNHHKAHNCVTCHLKYYDLKKHNMNYHYVYVCPYCTIRYPDETERNLHMKTCNRVIVDTKNYNREVSKIIKVCDLCSLFFKNTQKFRYAFMGSFSKEGERVPCERCNKQFFEVNLVTLTRRLCKERNYTKKAVSNESRLKTIHNRLKMINKLRKY